MVQEFLEHSWLQWAVGLAIGMPVLMILLGEVSIRLQNRGNALYKPINTLRFFVLPAAALALLVTQVVGWPITDVRVQLLNTVFWFFGLLAVLSFFNTALFINADVQSWRAKVPRIFIDIVRVLLIAAGVAVLLWAVWGRNPSGFFTALGVTSIVLGLVLQTSIGGIVLGLLVLFEQPFKIGDYLNIGGTTGKVVEVNWRATHLDTGNSLQIVPNSGLAGAQFSNFSRPELSQDDSLSFKFAATDPPNSVKRMLIGLARTLPQTDPDSEPRAVVTALDGSNLVYQITYTVRQYELMTAARDELLTRIWYAATRTGLTIVGLSPSQEAITAAVTRGLNQVAAQLYVDAEEVEDLVPFARIERFAAGEVVQDAGVAPSDVRFILSGRARVEMPDPNRGVIPMNTMETGDVFGGLTILAERTATRVIAAEDLETISIGREAMERLLERKPRLAQWFGEIADRRGAHVREVRTAARKRTVRSNGQPVAQLTRR